MKKEDEKKPKVIEHFSTGTTFAYFCAFFICVLIILTLIRSTSGPGSNFIQSFFIFDALSRILPFIFELIFAILSGGSNMSGGTLKFFRIGE